MPRTQLSGTQVSDGSIQRADLDVATAGSAVLRKIIMGTGVTFTSTGPDAGTGDVTINANGGGVTTSAEVAASLMASQRDMFHNYSPASAPAGTIKFADLVRLRNTSAFNNSGGGHNVASLSWYYHDGLGNPLLAMASENKFDNNVAATITEAWLSENQLASNVTGGVISNLRGVRSRIITNAGAIGTFFAFEVRVEANAGTISEVRGYHFPDLSAITGITTKTAIKIDDPAATITTAGSITASGAIVDQSIFYPSPQPSATGYTVTIPANKTQAFIIASADYATGTIVFPPKATTAHATQLNLVFFRATHSVTWSLNGAGSTMFAPTSIAAGQTVTFKYDLVFDAWMMIDTQTTGTQQQNALTTPLSRNRSAVWSPPGNSTSAPTSIGYTPHTVVGTATARNVAITNFFTRTRRLGYVSAATAGAFAAATVAVAQHTMGVAGSPAMGGFYKLCRFGCSDAATVAGARQFIGFSASTAAPTNVEPSTLINVIGIGHGAADTNLKIYFGGSVAQAPVDLGANFPVNTLSVDLYGVRFFCAPGTNNQVDWVVVRLNTNQWASGSLTAATPGTQLPLNTTLLTHMQAWRTNNATALAVGLDIASDYIDVAQ